MAPGPGPGRGSTSAKSVIKGATNAGLKKLKSSDHDLQVILKNYLENQKKTNAGINESKTDVLLICNDGIIPVHGVILQAVSPFFEKIFESQGPCMFGYREILLPDFSVDIMRYVVRLIYDQRVYMKYDFEMEEVEEVIACLQIYTSQKLSSLRAKKPAEEEQGDIACYPKSSKPFLAGPTIKVGEFGKVDVKVKLKPQLEAGAEEAKNQDQDNINENENDKSKSKTQDQQPTPMSFASRSDRRSTRGSAQNQNHGPVSTKSVSTDNDDIDAEISSESTSEEDSDDSSKAGRKRRRNKRTIKQGKKTSIAPEVSTSAGGIQLRNVKVALKKLSPSKASATPSTASRTSTSVRALKENSADTTSSISSSKKDADNTDSSTDKDIDESSYKDHEWFTTQAKKCQKCKKLYENAAEATQCLNAHSRLRCYFCFRVCKNTEQLFQHFQRAHKRAGRENFLMCPFCEQSIPFKSVSCHVISMHLSDTKKMNGKGTSSGGTPGRPSKLFNAVSNSKDSSGKSTETNAADSSGPSTKRIRLMEDSEKKKADDEPKELRVGDLHCTIRHVKKDGRTLVYSLRKLRSSD